MIARIAAARIPRTHCAGGIGIAEQVHRADDAAFGMASAAGDFM